MRFRRRFWAALGLAAILLAGCAGPLPFLSKPSPAAKPSAEPERREAPQQKADAPTEQAAPSPAPPPRPAAQPAPQAAQAPPAAPAQPPSRPAPAPRRDEGESALQFENVDVFDVLHAIANLLNLDYLIEPGVPTGGRVTIRSKGRFAKKDLFPILETVLQLNGMTIVKKGALYHIIPLAEAKLRRLEIGVGSDAEKIPDEDRVIIQIIPFKYLPASSVEAILKPITSKTATFIPVPGTNTLIVIDLASSIKHLLDLVALLDVNTFETTQVKLYPVKHTSIEAVVKELTEIFTPLGYGKGKETLKFIPLPRLGSLLVVNSIPHLASQVERWITTLDQPTQGDEAVYIYYVENGKATNIAKLLTELYRAKSRRAPGAEPAAPPAAPLAPPAPGAPPRPPAAPPTPAAPAAGVAPELTVMADEETNSLIIVTAPHLYPGILATIKSLDVPKKQVLIQVLILEVTLTDETQFGIEWSTRAGGTVRIGDDKLPFRATPQLNLGSLGAAQSGLLGLSAVLTSTDRLTALVKALSRDNKANVLSRPNILATDNKKAIINIGDSVPIITSQVVPSAGVTTGTTSTTSSAVITQTVQYVDTGVILTVTPHITDQRQVVMDIKQEVSSAVANVIGGSQSPIIQKRTAETSAVVSDGETVVLGGLITENRSRTDQGIPVLSKIPFLGYLFKSISESVTKRELVLLITPRVVGSPEEARVMSRDFEDQVQRLKQQLRDLRDSSPSK
jgi:general secretion pathway protein D